MVVLGIVINLPSDQPKDIQPCINFSAKRRVKVLFVSTKSSSRGCCMGDISWSSHNYPLGVWSAKID